MQNNNLGEMENIQLLMDQSDNDNEDKTKFNHMLEGITENEYDNFFSYPAIKIYKFIK